MMFFWVGLAVLLFGERLWKYGLVVRFFRDGLRHIQAPVRSMPRLVSFLQPILSGDPAMPRCLEHNLQISHPCPVEFLWLVDLDDEVGLAVCHGLMAKYPQVAIQLLTLPHSPQ